MQAKRSLNRPFILVMLLAMSLSGYRLYFVEVSSRVILSCQWCLTRSAVVHETQLLLFLVLLHLLSLRGHGIVRGLCRFLTLVVLMITAIDLVVLNQFLLRLTFHELTKYLGEYSAVADFLRQAFTADWKSFLVLGLSGVGLAIMVQYFRKGSPTSRPHPALIIGVCVLLLAAEKFKLEEYHSTYTKNSIEVFFTPESRHRHYSEAFIASVEAAVEGEEQCFEGLGARPNLIMVIVESLSMYHSQSFSGLQDWMPEFDRASERGTRYRRFYANGISTEDGLIAILTGQPPIPRGFEEGATILEQHQGEDTLPNLLNDLGYQTTFLTTGNLGFLNKGQWLKKIGFQRSEGHDAAFYSGMERFHFDAAADEALYARAMEELDAKMTTPFFLALENVSTHHPYVDPQSGSHSEEEVFRYADRQLGRFVRSLEAENFFQEGYLFIVSDHRAMIPMKSNESALYGSEGFARVPLVILGDALVEELAEPISQTDIFPSMRHWLGDGKQCVDRNQGIFLPSVIHKPECIYTRRSYNADNLYIRCGPDEYTVRLDGDDTRFVDGPEGSAELLQQVHRLRLGLGY